MKKMVFAAFLAAAAGFVTLPAVAGPVAYKLDPAHLTVAFTVNHLGFSNLFGRFDKASGEVVFDREAVEASAVSVAIDTASIDTNFAKRDDHLRSEDFFNVKEFPQMVFKSTKVEKTGERTGKLYGELTLLGATRPVVLDVTFNNAGVSPVSNLEAAGFSARGRIKRSDFGMKFGVPAIADDIDILIEAEAVKS